MEDREWLREGTRLFLTAVDGFAPADWDAPTLLDGWRRREVVAHVHHNAEAMSRLAHWARTGQESPMYASSESRDGDIARSAQLDAEALGELVHASARKLEEDLDALATEHWERPVRTHRGDTIPASRIPWIRAREVMTHAVDLDAGVGFGDLPDAFTVALVDDVVRLRCRRGEGATLAAWLTGRGVPGEDLGPWM